MIIIEKKTLYMRKDSEAVAKSVDAEYRDGGKSNRDRTAVLE